MRPELPTGWGFSGGLPDFDPAALDQLSPEYLHSLIEDLWWARSPSDRFEIDVGWYPEADAAGRFRCLLVEDEDWLAPREELNTTSLRIVVEWVVAAVAECVGAEGERGETMLLARRAGHDST
jgi:hypothetical protein